VHHSISGHFGIRDDNWKLMLARGSGGWTSPTELQAKEQDLLPVQLYNLSTDPGENDNLALKHPEIVAHLATKLGQLVSEGRSTPGAPSQNDVPVELWKSGTDTGIPSPDKENAR
jgi:hypothetical protein